MSKTYTRRYAWAISEFLSTVVRALAAYRCTRTYRVLHLLAPVLFYFCRSFEDSISSSTGAAALEQWIRYVDWIKTTYPSNAVENGLLEVLERATRSFSDDASMRDNVEYVKLWISYVSSGSSSR